MSLTPLDALLELLDRVGFRQDTAALVNEEELGHWPPEAVKALKAQRLLVKACPAASAVCPGCERECAMPVHTLPGTPDAPVSFIVCDKRDDINRVEIRTERLIQWRCGIEAVCGFIAEDLGLRRNDNPATGSDLREIGIAKGDKRSQMLCLKADSELFLVAGSNTLPLAEMLAYRGGVYTLDKAMVRQLVDSSTTADTRYTPTTVRREARKLETQAMHEAWKQAYRKLKKNHPGKSDVWYSQQIEKMAIAKGRDAETIRKNMKGK